ncbi:MAG: DMT family transporter [Anaerolineales bacterium]|jgi:transporter family-2 protein|nr:DMT family transporter [Anaerolineales bacterium]
MQALIIIISIGLIAGMAIGVQAPMSSMITQRMGMLESVFIIHLGGAIAALIPLFIWGSKFSQWRELPWYTFGAGAFGLIVISAMGFMIPRIGVAPSLIILLAGQLVIGSALDHYGWLGAVQRPFEVSRLLGLSVVMLGVWLTVK